MMIIGITIVASAPISDTAAVANGQKQAMHEPQHAAHTEQLTGSHRPFLVLSALPISITTVSLLSTCSEIVLKAKKIIEKMKNVNPNVFSYFVLFSILKLQLN